MYTDEQILSKQGFLVEIVKKWAEKECENLRKADCENCPLGIPVNDVLSSFDGNPITLCELLTSIHYDSLCEELDQFNGKTLYETLDIDK